MEENNIIDVTENIKNEIKSNDVVLFMKGTPVFPMCGFSAATVQVLSDMGVKFSSVNVLDSNEMREGIKKFSNWPTIPQLYVKEEFIGGCDIVKEMHETGELLELFNSRWNVTMEHEDVARRTSDGAGVSKRSTEASIAIRTARHTPQER